MASTQTSIALSAAGLATRRDAAARAAATALAPPPLSLGPETVSQRAHLAAARGLDLGPMPALEMPDSGPHEASYPASAEIETAGWRAHLGGWVDTLGFRVMRWVFSGAHRKELEQTSGYGELEAGWLARSEALTADWAEAYFPRPRAPAVELEQLAELPAGTIEDLRFSSAAYADRPGARYWLSRYPENATAHARCFRHAESAGRPAMLWLHGWGMGFPRIEAQLARARRFYDLGLDVYLVTLPYHAARRPAGVRLAGELFPTTHIARTNEGFLQALWECRALSAWHTARGGGPVGAMGLSLGGYVAAMLATFAPETAFAIGLMPVADVPTLMWSNGEGTAERAWAERAGVSFEVFCRSMAVHAPLAQPGLCIDPARVLLFAGRGDRIVPPQHAATLWQHWQRQPTLRYLPGSHLAPFGRDVLQREVEAHLASLGLIAAPA